MKINIKFNKIIPTTIVALAFGMTSCIGDLDVTPIDPNLDIALDTIGLFNKCYANLALQGNGGPNGDTDIDGIDGGTTPFIRQFINSNEMTTDEMICGWGDAGISQFDYNTYDASHPMMNAYFARLTTGISFCNQYINVASDFNATMTSEVRFLRAFQYYLLMDAFGNVPFATELADPVYYTRQEIFDWIESELLDIDGTLSTPKAKKSTDAGYGRIDQAANWMLLARLYLNSEVYTGTPQWDKAAQYAKKVMDTSYKLNTVGKNGWSAYQMLFMGDNGETDAAYEAIFPIYYSGQVTASFGGAQYLIDGTFDADMHPINPQDTIDFPDAYANINPATALNGVGVNGQWGGLRTRPNLIEKFFPNSQAPNVPSYQMVVAAGDDRALFDGVGRNYDNVTIGNFKDGYATTKFTNFQTNGATGSSPEFPETDFFVMRVAEAYLTYAEALTRQAGGTAPADAVTALNQVRARANAGAMAGFSLNDILDEWSREFYFEGHRRTDLIRFGKFGGNSDYIWQWKGGAYNGRNFESYRNIFAIPASAVSEVIIQNPGY